MLAADSTLTIGVAFGLNLLVMAYAIGKSQQKTRGELDSMRKDVNGIGQKAHNMENFLKETVPEKDRKRLTDLMR